MRTPQLDWLATHRSVRRRGHVAGWRRLGHLLLEASDRPGWLVETRDGSFTTGPGEGLLVLPGTEHRLTMVGDGLASTWTMMDCRWSTGADPLGGTSGALRVPAATMRRAATVLARIAAESLDPGWSAALRVLRARCDLLLLLGLPWCERPEPDPRIRTVLDLLAASPASHRPCAALARHAGLGLAQFHALFRRDVGESPLSYMNGLRLRQAQRLLASGTMGVAETAARCGFSCQFHFSRVFRRATGLSPRAYREQAAADRPT